MVMLYENQNDSVPYKELPLHVASTNKYGIFNFKNLSNNDFKIIALKDGNSNYKIDGTNEDIAFSDSIVKHGRGK